ncbi:MAG: hypothetical protein AAGN35_09230 [Bacteroidota bacterium]
MKPIYSVLLINLASFAIFGLMFNFVIKRPELIPLFTSFQASLNLLAAGVFYLDRKKSIWVSFLVGFALAAGITVLGYFVLYEWVDTIGVEEGYTL